MADASLMGLLDPVHGPALERVAVRPGELTRLQEVLNPPEAVPNAEDKRIYARICAREGLPAPELVAVLERRGDRAETVRSWAAILQRDAPEEAVVKPAEGHRGIGVRVLRRGSGRRRRPVGARDLVDRRSAAGARRRSLARRSSCSRASTRTPPCGR